MSGPRYCEMKADDIRVGDFAQAGDGFFREVTDIHEGSLAHFVNMIYGPSGYSTFDREESVLVITKADMDIAVEADRAETS